jgi:hypothetical protein
MESDRFHGPQGGCVSKPSNRDPRSQSGYVCFRPMGMFARPVRQNGGMSAYTTRTGSRPQMTGAAVSGPRIDCGQ